MLNRIYLNKAKSLFGTKRRGGAGGAKGGGAGGAEETSNMELRVRKRMCEDKGIDAHWWLYARYTLVQSTTRSGYAVAHPLHHAVISIRFVSSPSAD